LIHEDANPAIGFNGALNPSVASMASVKSGDIKVINVQYGTGTTRAKDIQ
jgi:hypothetical protein